MATWKKALLAIGFMFAVQAVLIHLENAHRSWLIAHLTGTTEATITAQDFSFHNTAHYQYVVDGKDYKSESAGWASDVRVGDSVVIHYDPAEPWINRLGQLHPPESGTNLLVELVLIEAFCLAAILVSYGALKRAQARPTVKT